MSDKREIKDKVTFRPTGEVRKIIEDELAANPSLSVTDICNRHLLIASKADFRRAYRAVLINAMKRLQDELRKFDDM